MEIAMKAVFKTRIIIIISSIITYMYLFVEPVSAEEQKIDTPQFHQMMGGGRYRDDVISPGVAALLSLQPMPFDFGNFYIDEWKKGILYTSVELGIFIPGMNLLGDHHSGHSYYFSDESDWTDNDRTVFYSLVAGYFVIKVISAFDSASTAEEMLRDDRVGFYVNPQENKVLLSARIAF